MDILDSTEWKNLKPAWNKLHKYSTNEKNALFKKISMGLPYSAFSDTKTQQRTSTCNTAILRVIKFLTISCPQCQNLVPGWVMVNGKVVPNLDFCLPGSFYQFHLDHEIVRDEENGCMKALTPNGEKKIDPSSLISFASTDKVEQHLRCTDSICFGYVFLFKSSLILL